MQTYSSRIATGKFRSGEEYVYEDPVNVTFRQLGDGTVLVDIPKEGSLKYLELHLEQGVRFVGEYEGQCVNTGELGNRVCDSHSRSRWRVEKLRLAGVGKYIDFD